LFLQRAIKLTVVNESHITVTSHVQNVSVIPLPRLSPYVNEITVDLHEIDWVVIRDSTFIRSLKKMGMQLGITAGLLRTSREKFFTAFTASACK
jgi:hypothetical protein